MSKSNPIILIQSDLFRYEGSYCFKVFLTMLMKNRYFRFQVYLRMTQSNNKFLSSFFKILKAGLGKKVNIQLSPKVSIGYGLYIPHGNIVINSNAIIGNNCTLLQFVTIGAVKNSPAPTIGNNVYIGPNTSIIGDIHIGNNSVLGAGSVAIKDVLENTIVVGSPAKPIKQVHDINEYSKNLCSDFFTSKAYK